MGFAKSGGEPIYRKKAWKRRMEAERDACGHAWQWDPSDRLMRCTKCGEARLARDGDNAPEWWKEAPVIIRTEGSGTDF